MHLNYVTQQFWSGGDHSVGCGKRGGWSVKNYHRFSRGNPYTAANADQLPGISWYGLRV